MAVLRYKGDTTGNGPSGFWADCPLMHTVQSPGLGYGFWDDFAQGSGTDGTITTLISWGNYTAFGSSGATITYATDAAGGAIILTEATDDESVSIKAQGDPFLITQDGGKLWFEARFKTSTITTAEQGWVVGLMDSTDMTAAIPVTATGTIADVNFVGFHHPEANTSAFDASYKANGVTAVEVNSDIGTLVAGTYVKVGFVYDPNDAYKMTFYVDGVAQTTKKVIPDAVGTDFPADVSLGPVIAQTLANSAAETLTMDWWGCYQLRV